MNQWLYNSITSMSSVRSHPLSLLYNRDRSHSLHLVRGFAALKFAVLDDVVARFNSQSPHILISRIDHAFILSLPSFSVAGYFKNGSSILVSESLDYTWRSLIANHCFEKLASESDTPVKETITRLGNGWSHLQAALSVVTILFLSIEIGSACGALVLGSEL